MSFHLVIIPSEQVRAKVSIHKSDNCYKSVITYGEGIITFHFLRVLCGETLVLGLQLSSNPLAC